MQAAGAPQGDPAARDGEFAERLRWQALLFGAEPERRALLSLHAAWPLAPLRVRVHRNHAVELALSVTRPFLEYAGFAPEWIVGDYDDSLTFSIAESADVDVVWLDFTRFADRLSAAELAGWLATRLAALRQQTSNPILVMDWDGPPAGAEEFADALRAGTTAISELHLGDRTEAFRDLGERFFDPDRERLVGTRMSAPGAVASARLLGSRWLPALVRPRLKAVVVDLDNTLYSGVLGEDGIDSVTLTPGHEEVQQLLCTLRHSGLFLGLLSRNESEDVERLFEARTDFPLRWEDFDARAIGWDAKSTGLQTIAEQLRIDPSACLFVDDNPGELLETSISAPDLNWLHASDDGHETARALQSFPGVWSFQTTETDRLRSADLRANQERDRAITHAANDLGAYYRELGVTLTIGHDQPDQLPRVAELSGKTNQFNLRLSRYSLQDVRAYAADDAWQVSAARLQDRLSDSGWIAILVARRRERTVIVEELCISCRALGRRLEDLIVAQMLVSGPLLADAEEVAFRLEEGPRNEPARRWLGAFAGIDLSADGAPELVSVGVDRVVSASNNPDVQVSVLR